MIRYGQHILLPCLEKLFNLILFNGVYPKSWSTGNLVTIFINGSPVDPNNYRGITINSCLSKLFNSILNKRLVEFIDSKKLIEDEQIGFRKGSRTTDHIFKLKTLLCKYLQKSGRLYACFVDLKKAFDSVLHPALLYKLQKYGINGNFLNVVQSMYSNSSLSVRVNE